MNEFEKVETVWMQHSKVSWLREVDQNTTFFQARASQRKKKEKRFHFEALWVKELGRGEVIEGAREDGSRLNYKKS